MYNLSLITRNHPKKTKACLFATVVTAIITSTTIFISFLISLLLIVVQRTRDHSTTKQTSTGTERHTAAHTHTATTSSRRRMAIPAVLWVPAIHRLLRVHPSTVPASSIPLLRRRISSSAAIVGFTAAQLGAQLPQQPTPLLFPRGQVPGTVGTRRRLAAVLRRRRAAAVIPIVRASTAAAHAGVLLFLQLSRIAFVVRHCAAASACAARRAARSHDRSQAGRRAAAPHHWAFPIAIACKTID
ncbi:hypothetical protein KC356_g245 [Hortaea werneckii]|nr:hypothetical protein KC356_g245 [Hortaea werneckii]